MRSLAAVLCALLPLACGDDRPRGERTATADDPLWWTGGRRPSREERGLAELRRLRDRACACATQECSEAVSEELMALSTAYSDLQPGSAIEAEAGTIVEELFRCASQLDLLEDDLPPPPPPDPVPDPVPTTPSATGVPECDAYVDAVRRFASCSKLPQATRDALEDSLQTMTQAWSGPGTLDPSTQQMMADACTQGTDAMKQSARVMGCPP